MRACPVTRVARLRRVLVALLVSALFGPLLFVQAFPGSAPASTCNTHRPVHGSPAAPFSTTPPPFTFMLQSNGINNGTGSGAVLQYEAGKNVTLLLSANDPATAPLRGLQLAAFEINADASVSLRRVGSFSAVGCQLMCGGQTLLQSHSGARDSLLITWMPPEVAGTGRIQFNLTAMQQLMLFWRMELRLEEHMPPTPVNAQFASVIDASVVSNTSLPSLGQTLLTVRVQTARPAAVLQIERLVIEVATVSSSTPRNFIHAVNVSVGTAQGDTTTAWDVSLPPQPPNTALHIRVRTFNRRAGLSSIEGAPVIAFTTSSLAAPLPFKPVVSATAGQQNNNPLQLKSGGELQLNLAVFLNNTGVGNNNSTNNNSFGDLFGFEVQMRITFNSSSSSALPAARRLVADESSSSAPLVLSDPDAEGWRSFFVPLSSASSPLVLPLRGSIGDEVLVRLRLKSVRGSSPLSDVMRLFVSSLCLNACSNRGQCMQPAMVCNCDRGFLGADCALASQVGAHAGESRGPACFGAGGSFCIDWALMQSDSSPASQQAVESVALRVTIRSRGYAGLLFDAPDGMSGGFGYMLVHTSTSTSTRAVYSPGLYDPVDFAALDTSVALSAVSWANATHSEFMFVKHATLLPALQLQEDGADTQQHVAWAFGQSEADDHFGNAGKLRVHWLGGRIVVVGRPKYEQMYASMMVALGLIVLVGTVIAFVPEARFSSWGNLLSQERLGKWKADNASGWLNQLTLDFWPTLVDFLWGEALGGAVLVAGAVAFLAAGYDMFVKVGMHGGLAWAHLSTVMYAIVLLPVTKSSVCAWLFQSSFERVLKWHRIIGRWAVVATYVHMIDMLVVRGTGIATSSPSRKENQFGLVALIAFSILIVTAWEPIRRRAWRLFIASHLLCAPVGFIFACLHSKYVWWLCLPSLCLWVVDLSIRFLRPFVLQRASLVSARLIVEDDAAPSVWTALEKPSKGSRFISVLEFDVSNFPEVVEPGSYVFLHVAQVAALEFHPISISNCPRRDIVKSGAGGDPNSSRLTLHVLDAGSNFSHNLRLRIEALQKDQARAIANGMSESEAMARTARALQVRVDGPYGRAQVQLHRYRVLVLVGGGIGITPLLSCLEYLVEQLQSGAPAYAGLAQVHLCWSSRLQSSFEWSRELLQRSQMLKQRQVQLHLFVWSGPDPVPRVQQVKELAAKHGSHARQRRSHLHQHGVQEKPAPAQIEMQSVPAAVHAAASPVSAQFLDASSLPQSPSLASVVEEAATKPSHPHPHVPHQRVAPMGPRTSTIVGADEYFASNDAMSPTFHTEDGASSVAAAAIAVERPVYIAPVVLTPEEMLSVAAESVAADGGGVRHRHGSHGSLTPSMVRLHAEAESVVNRAEEADDEQEHGASAAASSSPNTAPASATAGSGSAAVSSGESHRHEHSVSGISCAGGSHAPDCLSAWSPPVEFGIADYGTFFKQLASDAAALDLLSLPPHHAARLSGVPAHSVAVLACGPPGLVADVQRRAQKLNFHFHKESFLF